MHKFNEKSLTIDLIHHLLYKYWLPIYDTIQPGDYIHLGFYYIQQNNVIKCTKSGIYLQISDINSGAFEIIWSYDIGGRYRKFTDNYIPTTNYYSSADHERLGKFVLAYSDVTGINLKPYYNCNSNKYIDNLYIAKLKDETTGKNTYDLYDFRTKKRILVVPIRFNRTYTVAIDCASLVLMCPIFLTHDRKLIIKLEKADTRAGNEDDISMSFLESTNQVYSFPSMSFTDLKYIKIKCTNEIADKYLQYLRNLYLMILLPEDNTSSVVVLEGEYKRNFSEYTEYTLDPTTKEILLSDSKFGPTKKLSIKTINMEKIYSMTDYDLNKFLISNLSLLLFNTTVDVPFANRLTEYLFDNVIDHTWKLDGNIARALSLLENILYGELDSGIWTTATRAKMYDYALGKKNSRHIDINGFIDKETERLLMKSMYNGENQF